MSEVAKRNASEAMRAYAHVGISVYPLRLWAAGLIEGNGRYRRRSLPILRRSLQTFVVNMNSVSRAQVPHVGHPRIAHDSTGQAFVLDVEDEAIVGATVQGTTKAPPNHLLVPEGACGRPGNANDVDQGRVKSHREYINIAKKARAGASAERLR